MIIAVDFDGTLTKSDAGFPSIGEENSPMIRLVSDIINEGHEVILWTSRTDKALEDAVDWCKRRGIEFCAVNDNSPNNKAKYASKYPNGTRKVYADIYLDDHSPEFILNKKLFGVEIATTHLISCTRRLIRNG